MHAKVAAQSLERWTMYRNAIEQLNALQESRLQMLTRPRMALEYANGPATKTNGLYWIYTDYTDDDLLAATPSPKRKSIVYADMLARHEGLGHICKHEVDGFRLIYNGMGGVGRAGHGGLRERILGEFRGGQGTGSLAICGSSLSDLTRWRVSYVLWEEITLPVPWTFREFGEGLERLWRLHYGWPVICTR